MRESKSRPDAGLLELRHTAFNQRGEDVATCLRTVMVRRKPKNTQGGPF
jgi:acyl dehydratase